MSYLVYICWAEKCRMAGIDVSCDLPADRPTSAEKGQRRGVKRVVRKPEETKRTCKIAQDARNVLDAGRVPDRPIVHLDRRARRRFLNRINEDIDRRLGVAFHRAVPVAVSQSVTFVSACGGRGALTRPVRGERNLLLRS